MAKYCLRRLSSISKKGPRGKPPSVAEIETASVRFTSSSVGLLLFTFALRMLHSTHRHLGNPWMPSSDYRKGIIRTRRFLSYSRSLRMVFLLLVARNRRAYSAYRATTTQSRLLNFALTKAITNLTESTIRTF